MSKPGLPQGTRDFGPAVVRKRNYIFQIIKEQFERYGFQPLETPAMENLDTLMGKYGDEGDKLIFKILNNGLDNPDKQEQIKSDFEKILAGKNNKGITERALRYDLTIPFARYVAMNHNQLSFPFKRYQIQPVWRADRPQKGRYREFYQCDADVVGTKSLISEMELICLYNDVFKQLGLNGISICINHRTLLTALAELCGASDKLTTITVAIDKLDKIGIDKVKAELAEKGINAAAIQHIESYLQISGSNENIIEKLTALLGKIEQGKTGLQELKTILAGIAHENIPVKIDPTLARGLNYYTGLILEVKAPTTVQMGSIGGGGRYDDLTGLFGVAGIPGVGISFGVDRIYDVMEELNLFPTEVETGTQALFFNLGEKEAQTCFTLLQEIRKAGIRIELYPENIKFDKQFKYAEKKKITYAIIIGDAELTSGVANVKNLETGKQETVQLNAAAIIEAIRK